MTILSEVDRIEMARSTRNSRCITINDFEYRWRAKGDDGYITFTIWSANAIGPVIRGNFQYHETWLPQGDHCSFSAGDQIVITNRILRRVIEFAVQRHAYNPLEKGSVLNLRRMDHEIDISDAVRATDLNT